MAQSAFKVTAGKRIPDGVQSNCIGGATLTQVTQNVDTTRIRDRVTLKYPGFECPAVGDIVRYDSSLEAYSLADARIDNNRSDPEDLAEAIGVVEELILDCRGTSAGPVEANIVYFGKIDFANHMDNKSLTPGRVYYLADTEDKDYDKTGEQSHQYRNGTTREPERISKPVYIATGQTTAIVTNFRGLMGGIRDPHGDEIVVTTLCRPYGFVVTILNNGPFVWKLPISRIAMSLNRMTGEQLVGEPVNQDQIQWIQPGSLVDEETENWVTETNPFALGGSLTLNPAESKEVIVGWKSFPVIGKLETTLYTISAGGTESVKATTESTCVPHLQLTAQCADDTDSGVATFEVRHLRSDGGVNPVMTENITYGIQEWDQSLDAGEGNWKELQVDDGDDSLSTQGAFTLPNFDPTDGSLLDSYHMSPVLDEVAPSSSGKYRIQFNNVVQGHWAAEGPETSLGDKILECDAAACSCEEGENCLVFPNDVTKRETYGQPLYGGYDLTTGKTSIGDGVLSGWPHHGITQLEPTTFEGAWNGTTDRETTLLCGTDAGTEEALRMNFSFVIPDSVAICMPKLYDDDIDSGVSGSGWSIRVWKSRELESQVSEYILLGFGDVPVDTEKTATILLDYNGVTWDRCFSVKLTGSHKKYYLDEIFND